MDVSDRTSLDAMICLLVDVLGMKAMFICMKFLAEVGVSQNPVSSNSREFQTEAGKLNLLPSQLSIGVLQEIGRRCSSKVWIGLVFRA